MCGTRNFEEFGFDPKEIDAVFITHPHVDHTGRLPKLIKEGYTGPVYMLHPCVTLSKIVLEDTAHIMQENADKCGDQVLYEPTDVKALFAQAEGVGYHEEIAPAKGHAIMFHDAGHVLGSAFISLEAEGMRIIFSGDVGNDNVPILPDTEPISKADYVICESTYGNRLHENVKERAAKLRVAIERTIRNKSVLMIPAFSIERTQELLYELDQILLHELQTDIPIYLDSPMAIRATQAYRDYKGYLKFDAPILEEPDRDFFSFPNLIETLNTNSSKAINDAKPPKIIIAGSGMMSGGRIMHHLKRYLQDEKNTLLIIGFQAEGTLGRQIYDGKKMVRIYNDDVMVKARVESIGAFSAHADQEKLTRWLHPEEGPMPKQVFLVHGDPEVKMAFKAHLEMELKTKITIPELHSSHEL